MMNIKVRALVHSTNTVKEVTLIEKTDDNKYIVRTDSGVLCTAIFNPFTNLYYADDLYGKIEED
ncbi:MAG: hypothetical protein [Bacteriophage sp.]|jgi:hypothetical protein|nr:MAG: hypothetical protein [Bacteriophage sp.]